MKILNVKPPEGLFGRALTTALLFLSLAVAAPYAHALTSGNATIFNQATVNYLSGTNPVSAQADVSVTVITLAADPTVTVDTTAQTVDAGANAVYNYTLRSNANGVDTYNLSLASVDANVTASTDGGFPTTSTLWGGIVIDSPLANQVRVPGGSVGGDLTANVSTVEVFDDNLGVMARFTVTAISAGNAESAGTAEVYDTLTLAPIAPSVAFGAGDIVAGTQIGEYAVTTLTQQAGNPSTPGTDGTHTNNMTVTSTATEADNVTVASYTTSSGDGNETITTVNSPAVTITKLWRNVTAGTTFGAPGPGAKPNEVIEYEITVTGDPGATVTNVYLTDIIPTYTAILNGQYAGPTPNATSPADVQIEFTDASAGPTTTTTYALSSGGGVLDQAELSGGTLTVTVGAGAADATVPTGGTLDAGDSAVVRFQVTVQ
ncbi:MAG: hypothetical protein AMJ68_09490 [Acidithiobacillales bacterium SG8_45]|nr:MAG: hypothetical protein AMJ68_09490 [Acidithiobacillales bacterium SG8_45]